MAKMTWDGRATFLRMMDPKRFVRICSFDMNTIRLTGFNPEKSVSYQACEIIGIEPTYQNRRSICLAARKLLKRSKAR